MTRETGATTKQMEATMELEDLFDDHVAGYLLPKIMYALKQERKGDPLKDFLDSEDETEAFALLEKIGKAIGVKAKKL